jgi:hypothetical protein
METGLYALSLGLPIEADVIARDVCGAYDERIDRSI